MKPRNLSKIIAGLAFPAVFLFAVAGCLAGPGAFTSYVGRSVHEEQRIPLLPGQHSARWEGRDLSVEYRYARDGNALDISGTIRFADSISYNFERIHDFILTAFFTDSQGKILENRPLTTVGRFEKSVGTDMDPIRFQTRVILPPDTATIAFGYSGNGYSAGDSGRRGRIGGGGGGGSYFWHYPVR